MLFRSVSEEAALREFEDRYRREYGVFYEFLMAFYDMNVSEDSYFWSAKKITKNSHAELESFVDLVGGLSSGETILADAEAAAAHIKAGSAEFAGAIDQLDGGEGGSMVPLFKSSVAGRAMQEGAQVQVRARLGADAGMEDPLFPGGLVPSADGMFWARP